jgi:hypothetical protein
MSAILIVHYLLHAGSLPRNAKIVRNEETFESMSLSCFESANAVIDSYAHSPNAVMKQSLLKAY